jgi:hypothetical protein
LLLEVAISQDWPHRKMPNKLCENQHWWQAFSGVPLWVIDCMSKVENNQSSQPQFQLDAITWDWLYRKIPNKQCKNAHQWRVPPWVMGCMLKVENNQDHQWQFQHLKTGCLKKSQINLAKIDIDGEYFGIYHIKLWAVFLK